MNAFRAKIRFLILSIIIVSPSTWAWPTGMHAYIADKLHERENYRNINEMYGAMAVDVFIFIFNTQMDLATHTDFIKVWDAADPKSRQQHALAFGFVAHNDVWGMDYTAHHAGRTFGQQEGYVIAKAAILEKIIKDALLAKQDPLYQVVNQLPAPLAALFFHTLVEGGIDILMKKLDPLIGYKVSLAALLRSPQFPSLLVKAYATDFSALVGGEDKAKQLILQAEANFRKTMISYGQALTQKRKTAIKLIAAQTVELAQGFLAAANIQLPPGVDIAPLIEEGIRQSIAICKDDFADEVEATLVYVKEQLQTHGIDY